MPGWVEAWVAEMEGRGVLLPGGHELRPVSDARTVRVRTVGRPVYREWGDAGPGVA